jgi:hypothetical protein
MRLAAPWETIMKIFKTLPVAVLLALISISYSFAETLTIDVESPAAPGASGVSVDINIDDGSNTAGASFTITYDTTKLTLIGVSSSFFGLPHKTSLLHQ